MATYYVWSGGSNTAPYDTWAKAATTFTTGVGAANANGDIILVHYTHTEELAADTTYTFLANVNVISVDKDNSNALAVMGTAAWIGNSTANRAILISGAVNLYFNGVTLRTAGATADTISLLTTDGMHVVYEDCYIWHGNTATTSRIALGAADTQGFVHLRNTTLRFGNASQSLRISVKSLLEGVTISSAGSALTNFIDFSLADPGGGTADIVGCDLSALATSANLVANSTTTAAIARFSQCKLPTSFVMLATQTNLNRSSAEVYLFDCAVGDTHGVFGYQDMFGTAVSDTGIYFTSGAAAQSWKITTTANCSYYTPFVTPWFGYYNTTTTAVTPYVEILRDGSATAYQNDEVWMDVAAKTTAGSTQSTLYTDRMALLGTPANQDAGAGTGSWTGESGTAWSGKLALGSSITPAENGHISARIVVGEPSITVYADPQIRT